MIDTSTIVAEARSWVGTPYHHAADIKGVGVDCAMLLLRVYADLGLVAPFDPRPYTTDWMLHRSDEIFMGHLFGHATEVETPEPGDVILFKFGRCYSHGGIVTCANPLTIVHAVIDYGKVVEEPVAQQPRMVEKLPTAKFARPGASL